MGVVIGLTIMTYCNALITWKFAGSLINLTVTEILKNLFPSLVVCLLMAALVHWGGSFFYGESPGLGKFLFQVMLGIFIYPCLLVLLKPRGYIVVRDLFLEKVFGNKKVNKG